MRKSEAKRGNKRGLQEKGSIVCSETYMSCQTITISHFGSQLVVDASIFTARNNDFFIRLFRAKNDGYLLSSYVASLGMII